MEYKTYYQLKRMSKKEIWDIGIKDGSIDAYAQKLYPEYYDKATILEMMSVTHREWIK